MASQRDIAFHLGNAWRFNVNCKDAAGQPVLDIQQAEWRVADATGLKLRVSLVDNISIPTPGTVQIQIPTSKQSALNIQPNTKYTHELWIMDGDGDDSIQVTGNLTLLASLKSLYP